MLGDVSNNETDDSVSKNPNVLISKDLDTKAGRRKIAKLKIFEFILELYDGKIDKPDASDGLFLKKTVRKKFNEFVLKKKYNNHFPKCDIGTLLRDFNFLKHTPKGSESYCIPVENVLKFYRNNFGNLYGMSNVNSMNSISSESNGEQTASSTESLRIIDIIDNSRITIEKNTIAKFVLKLFTDQHLQGNGNVSKITVRREFEKFLKDNNFNANLITEHIGTLLRDYKFLEDTPRGSNNYCIPIPNLLEYHKENVDTFKINDEQLESLIDSVKAININKGEQTASSTESLGIIDGYKNGKIDSAGLPLNLSRITIEKPTIAKFILKLFTDQHLQGNGNVSKITVRREFDKFLKDNDFNTNLITENIGTLLRDYKFLEDTPRGSNNYCIPIQNLLEYHKENVNGFKIDDKQIESLIESVKTININKIEKVDPKLSEQNLNKTPIGKAELAEFILKLYHDLHLEQNGDVLKSTVRMEFIKFLNAKGFDEASISKDIGTLLREAGCLYNTPRNSPDFRISFRKIFECRNEKLKQFDEARINENTENRKVLISNDIPLEASIEVSAYAEEFPLVFQGGCKQQVDPNFKLSNLGCYICQTNFKNQSLFEDHVTTHSFESDFEFLSNLERMDNIFEINYRLCNKSHFFSFTMKTKNKDVVIEKIIVIQTRLMQFVKNHLVPYEIASDGMDSFLIDSHLFTIGVEQPVVVVYRYKSDKKVRHMEQHHFLRIEEFPKVHFSIRSTRLSSKSLMKMKFQLSEYHPDDQLKLAQKFNFTDESLMNVSDNFKCYLSEKSLNEQNICDVLTTELQIEDLESAKDYYPLQQKAARIKRFGKEYSVKLKNLPKNIFLENIVTPLDEIILTSTDKPKNSNQRGRNNQLPNIFVAIIERVYFDTVCFKYDREVIDSYTLYDIVLRPSRLSLKYQYRALEQLLINPAMTNYLFPLVNNIKQPTCLTVQNLEFFNSSIKTNAEQLQAVLNITYGNDCSAPYIIFGPPGTGKTSTIVEAIFQLWKTHPDTRILITAGSNAACDEVAVRLCRIFNKLQTENFEILRIFSKSNEKRLDSIEDVLLEASNFYGDHFYPSIESIRMFRIVVCTLSIVGKLVSANIGNQFFTHIFIDECAASTEPEALVALIGTSNNKTKLILSGDYKQLGAVLKSRRAGDLGLKVSLMERLLNRECYRVEDNGDYDRSLQTRLIRNYRSHPEIVSLFSNLYYDNELKALANKEQFSWASQWHKLPNRKHPVIFHSVYGTCKKINNSVSLCNEQEVNAVMDYVKDLLYFGMKDRKIDESDIGIISPYKKQYTRIQEELSRRRWHRIEVGAVETFQGKEKPIIIVSTVRSFTQTLGFLESPNRLNVILSRAIALLIIIGNPKTLSQNKDFKFIIEECQRNNCLIGGVRTFVEVTSGGNTNNSSEASVSKYNLNMSETKSKLKRTGKNKANASLVTKITPKKTVFSKNIHEANLKDVRNLCSSALIPPKVNFENLIVSESQKGNAYLDQLKRPTTIAFKDNLTDSYRNRVPPQQPKPQATVIPRTQALAVREPKMHNFMDNTTQYRPVVVPSYRDEYVVVPRDKPITCRSSNYESYPRFERSYIPLEEKKPKTKGCVIA